MTLADAKKLIATPLLRTTTPQKWADMGCGSGLFSKALSSLLPDQSVVYAIDIQSGFLPPAGIHFLQLDFEKDELPVPLLQGIIMANSLHFVNDKLSVLQKLTSYLQPGAGFLVVEYDTDTPNRWVPYPMSYSSLARLFSHAGFDTVKKINERQSLYNSTKIYSAYIYSSNQGNNFA